MSPRLSREKLKQDNYRESQSEKGKKGGRPPKPEESHGFISAKPEESHGIIPVKLPNPNPNPNPNPKKAISDTPVDNSTLEKDAFISELNNIKNQIREKYPQFKFDLFIQNNLRRKNHKAIIHTLKTLTTDTVIENPMAWCETILKKESMNYNAADSENQSNEYKKHDLTGFGAILNKIQTQGA
jgi:hypothetical protein